MHSATTLNMPACGVASIQQPLLSARCAAASQLEAVSAVLEGADAAPRHGPLEAGDEPPGRRLAPPALQRVHRPVSTWGVGLGARPALYDPA